MAGRPKYKSAEPHRVIQYRSKVSYHPSYRFSRDETLVARDETLVSREPLMRIFWNTLQAVGLWDNDEFLATRWSLPCESIWYFGNCLTRCFKRNQWRLTSEKPKWKRGKMNVKDVHENLCSAVDIATFALQRIGFAKIWSTASEWKLASQDPILSLLMKKLDGNNFYNLKLRLQRKSSRNRRVVSGLFLAHGAANFWTRFGIETYCFRE